jgi:CRP/FNR family transcriptional regulator, cyclic AMP receptor protein
MKHRQGSSLQTSSVGAVGPKEKKALTDAHRLLDNCVLFGSLSPDERAAISARAHVRTYKAGETVFAMGSPGDQVMALLSGTIRISVPFSEGKELFLAIIQPGEIFGELAVLDGNERSADAIAETPCTLAILGRNDILSFFERNPSVWPKLVKLLVQRLRQTDQAFAEVALLQLPVRLAKTILRILNREMNSTAAKTFKIRVSQRELANMVGTTRESVNKCFRNWQKRDGIVKISEGSIIITNRRAFERIADVT